MGRNTQQNSITSDEKTKLINPFNMQLREDFLAYLRSVQRSPQTIRAYASDLLIIFTYILERAGNKKFTELTKRELVAFQNWLIHENNNSPARVRRLKATISSLSNYITNILDDEDEFKNFKPIVKKIESPVNQPVREKLVLSDEQLDGLFSYLLDTKQFREACMLALAAYSGRRKSELVLFKVHYFDDENIVLGSLYKTPEKIKTKGRGNGKFIHCYTLSKKFKPYLDLWLADRKEKGIESEWLFPLEDDYDQHMKADTLNSWAVRFSKILGVDFYWHSLRHFFTTDLIRSGLPDRVIQDIVGWTSADMVKVYTDLDTEEQIGMYFHDGEIVTPTNNGFGQE